MVLLSRVSVTIILSQQMKHQKENTYAGLYWELEEAMTLLTLIAR